MRMQVRPPSAPAPLEDDFLRFESGAPEGDSLDLTQYLGALRRRWPLILICCLISGAYGFIRYSLTTKMYQATAVIQIERRQLATIAMGGQTNWLEEWWNMEYYPTQYRLLRSRGMAERVVSDLRLYEDPMFTGREADLLPQDDGDIVSVLDDQATLARYASRLRGGLVVQPIRDTQLVELTYRAERPELAARVANGYAQAFISWGIETRNSTVGRASEYLSNQIRTLGEELENLRSKQRSYQGEGDFALDPAGEALVERQQTLETRYNQAVAARIGRQAAYNELAALPDDVVANTVAGGQVVTLRSELYQLEGEYQAKLERFKPEWPAMVTLKETIDRKKAEIQGMLQGTVNEARGQARAAYQQALGEEKALEAALRGLNQEALALNSTALESSSVNTQIQTRQELLNELLKRQSETQVASSVQDARESNVRIVDSAIVPAGAYRPVLRKDLSSSLLLGFLIGAGAIVLLEFFDRTVKSSEELEKLTGLPTLAVIPDLNERRLGYSRYLRYGKYSYGSSYEYGYGESRKKGGGSVLSKAGALARRSAGNGGRESAQDIELLPHFQPRLAVSEAYRSLRTALLLSSAVELKTVAVTSAEPAEGKTSTTANLAVVLAQMDRKVLVVDCDLRRPRMHTVFKVPKRVGVVNYLTNNETLDRLILPTTVPNLFVCPCGPIPPNPSELLASDRMRELLAGVRDRFDFILLDTPPVLPVVDAAIVGQLVDGIVVCCHAGKLQRDQAKACRDRLRYQGIRLLGTVINRYTRRGGGAYSRQYYYADTYEEEPTAANTAA